MPRRLPRFALPLVLLLCAALYLVGNARVALWDRDEPRYAMASRHMLQSGDWVVPRVGWGINPELPRTAKPALIYWAQASAMAVLGPSAFAARLPSALATTVLLVVLAILLSRYVSPAHAFWTVGILGTSAMLVVASKMCITDTVLLLFTTLGQLCLLALYRGHRRTWVAGLMWVFIALAGLTKGPVVLGVYFTTMLILAGLDAARIYRHRPVAALVTAGGPAENLAELAEPRLPLAYYAGRTSDRTAGLWRSFQVALGWWPATRPLLGLLILAIVCGPWLLLVHNRDPSFLSAAVSHDVIDRMKTGLEEHTGPPGYYIATLFATFFPWSLLLPLTFVIAVRRMRVANTRFALAAVIGPWILMELVRTKLVHYVLPIFPPLSFLAADAVLRCLRHRHDGLVSRFAVRGVTVWATAVAAIVVVPWLILRYYHPVPVAALAAMTAVGLVYAVLVWRFFATRRPAAALVTMGAGFGVFIAIAFAWFVPDAEFLRLSPRVADILVSHGATHQGDVLMLGYKEQSLAFYQGGTIDEVWANYLAEHDPKEWPRYAVLTPSVLEALPQEKRDRLETLASLRGLNYAAGRWTDVMVVRKK